MGKPKEEGEKMTAENFIEGLENLFMKYHESNKGKGTDSDEEKKEEPKTETKKEEAKDEEEKKEVKKEEVKKEEAKDEDEEKKEDKKKTEDEEEKKPKEEKNNVGDSMYKVTLDHSAGSDKISSFMTKLKKR